MLHTRENTNIHKSLERKPKR